MRAEKFTIGARRAENDGLFSVALDADSDGLTFAWTLTSVPAGSAAMLSAATSAKPAFVADMPDVYLLRMVVNEGQVDSPVTSVSVTANP